MQNLISLKQLIENEFFVICPFLTANQFVKYCKERSINTSKQQLEKLEKLGIFLPIARVNLPKIKTKIEYIENGNRYKVLGILQDDEKWNGDIKEEYAHFWFEKNYAKEWYKEGILWDPSTREFHDWDNFRDKDGRECIVSYYSIFQCYTLYDITRNTKLEIHAERWYTYSDEEIIRKTGEISEWAKKMIDLKKKSGVRELAPIVCQVLSNNYFPLTQTDQRTINLPHYHNWKWDEYREKWNPNAILSDLLLSINDIEKLHQVLSMDAKFLDPLANWYGLINFVSLKKKRKLKGKALLAQSIYSMEHMIRLFYEELTGKKIYPPDENISWKKENYYGTGVTDNDLQYLEFLTNEYHLNSRPKLILIVEGNSEEEQFPRLSQKLFGYTFSTLGIEVINIHGVAGFTGQKRIERYGALEKFIDYHHNRQTIVFVVLDNEGRVNKIKNRLIKAQSKLFPDRFVTKAEYIHLWAKKTVEFDNFSFEEIAKAMSEINKGEHTFTTDEIEECYLQSQRKESDHLSMLYKERTGYDLSKRELLRILCDFIIKNGDDEFDSNGNPIRPIIKVLDQIIDLVIMNHPFTCKRSWEINQKSGYFGDIKK